MAYIGNSPVQDETVSSAQIIDGAIVNADVNSSAAIAISKTALVAGTGITLSTNTLNLDAAQTGITSLLATDIKFGEDDQTKIDFETADEIHFYAANVEQVYLGDNIFGPQSDSDVDLGATGVRWKDAFVDSITVTGEVDAVTLDISGNADIDGTANLDVVDIDGAFTQDGGAVFNEDSADVDFRVESNGNTHMLFVDAGNDRVGIGTSSPGLQFVVNAADGKSDNAYVSYIGNQEVTDDRSYGLQIVAGSTVNDAPLFIQDHDGSNDLMIVRGNGAVGIGGTAPTELLEIFSSSTPAIQLTQTGGTSYNGGIKLAGNDLEIRGSSGIMEFYNGGNNDGDSATLRMAITAAGNVGIATGTTVNNKFQVQVATDHRIGFWGDTNYSAIQSVNDANSAQMPLRFDATAYSFYGTSTTWNHSPEISASDSSTSATFGLKITNSSSTSDTIAGIIFKNYDNNAAWIRSTRTGSAEGNLIFGTNSGGGIAESNIGEKMRITAGGNVSINDNDPEGTMGLTINQGGNDDIILSLKSSDIAHGVTDYAETDTYGFMKKYSASQGGLVIGGMTTHERPVALQAYGNYYATPAGGTAVDKCAIQMMTYEVSGTGITNVGSNESIFSVRTQKGGSMQTVFIVDTEGDLHADGSTSITGYDYAEYFEWTDGNPDNEDRVGYSVVLDGDKIRKATEGETPIGIISGTPAVVGDNPMGWHGTWKTDEWGRKIPKEVEWVRWEYDFQSEEGAEVVKKEQNWKVSDLPKDLEIPDNAEYINRLEGQYSDEYDPSQSYTMREARQEWSAVGLMGKLRLRKGQPVASTWIKMRDEGNNIEMWLVK